MDPRRNLLKNGWITLLAAFAVVVVLAMLPSRSGAAGAPWLYNSGPAHSAGFIRITSLSNGIINIMPTGARENRNQRAGCAAGVVAGSKD